VKYIGYLILLIVLVMTIVEVGWKIVYLPFAIVFLLVIWFSGAKLF
jgi:hypothetical protein